MKGEGCHPAAVGAAVAVIPAALWAPASVALQLGAGDVAVVAAGLT